MGTRERRKREVAERETLFLDAALELIRQDGLLSLQMARIAERCEYAVGTLYLHFVSKEDLLLALTTRYVHQHLSLFQRVGAWKASTRDRMFAIGVADMLFVQRNPDYFRIAQYSICEVVWKAASLERRQELMEANDPLTRILIDIVAEARAAGDLDLSGQSAQELSTGIWGMVSGYHNLAHAEGLLEDFSVRKPYLLMCRHLQYLLNGFGWKPLTEPADKRSLDALVKRICKEVFDDAICYR